MQAGKVVIVDEFTGRLMPGRRWSEGLHQAVEAKEGVKVEPENVTYATITIQNYFRMYEKLAGMSGTALTESEEFYKIYKLDVLPIPMNLEYQALRKDSAIQQIEAKDAQGYRYGYYARRDDPKKTPVFYRRKDYPDVVYRTNEAKLRAITMEILLYACLGRPQLVGTTSVEHSETLSSRLGAELLRRLAQVLILRDLYLEINKIDPDEQRAIPELAPFIRRSTVWMLPNCVSWRADLAFRCPSTRGSGEHPASHQSTTGSPIFRRWRANPAPAWCACRRAASPPGLTRKHDEESKIIAKAGSYGAVTIATNMAGRGVDIKLGGELDEEIQERSIVCWKAPARTAEHDPCRAARRVAAN